jgi:hypothetical protein
LVVGYTREISIDFSPSVTTAESEFARRLAGLVSSFSAAEFDDELGLLSLSSKTADDEEPTSSEALASSNFFAIVLFLAAALAFAACTRTARLASEPTPPEIPDSNGTNATTDGLSTRMKGSSCSSLGDVSGDANGLLVVDREEVPRRLGAFGI